ncbi:class I SAM-dependent methyltransferase [Sporosarcina sp. Marseille-Q4063]|uniref:class I SAM-dependent methyltransferase n=1 Tax=Sporosarcina sp. Marseille-Q4063 TaxID=2810514 RepID=UPI001BAF9F1A|nr:class I SAM-dependent methyltransferase [Sporosarcina sp. Marseille-Q4063]QUW22812.1 class I SAM-dependent methyltransferase [Sporosarcina sp. Marseille-Q4063]
MNQKEMSGKNRIGWSQYTYEAWQARHGSPKQFAKKLKENPEKPVQYYLDELGEVSGKRVLNLLGSKGNKAVCFALLGADVTVVDISPENQRYALELADEAGVFISYFVSDALDIDENLLSTFDIIILEMGVLHYFLDLHPLFCKVAKLMDEASIFILRDYHPFISKVLDFENGILAAEGDYFNDDCVEVDVAYSHLLTEKQRRDLKKNVIRRWTISETINALIYSGLSIRKMKEDKGIRWTFPKDAPNGIENRLPGTYAIHSTLK